MDTDALFARGWAVVGLWLRFVQACFGDPAALMERGWIARGVRAKLLVFLRTAEALARRLLLARAAEVPPENDPPRAFGMGRASSGYGRGGFAQADPARWSVTFRLIQSRRAKPANVRRRRPSPLAPATLAPTAPLAERIEALARVIADPERFARRLARRRKQGGAIVVAAPPTPFVMEVWEALAPIAPRPPPRPADSS